MKKKILLFFGLYLAFSLLTLLIFYLNGAYIWTTLPTSLVFKRIICIPLFLTLIVLLNIWLFNKNLNTKKRKVILLGLVFLLILGFISGIIDYNRIKRGKMPVFVISELDKSGPEIEYYGLNYKVVRKPGVSFKEEISQDIYVKFGFWFYTWVIKTNV